MGDLGVSNNRTRNARSSGDQGSNALARLKDNAPGIAQQVASAAVKVDDVLDRVPLAPYESPKNPSGAERVAAGVMSVVYAAGGGVSLIPFVGSWIASAAIAGGGALARMSNNPEVKNQGNLALQTTGYGLVAEVATLGFGGGSLAYFRAAAKSAAVAMRG